MYLKCAMAVGDFRWLEKRMPGTIDRVYEKMHSNFSMNSGGDLHLLYSEGRWDFSLLLSCPLRLSLQPSLSFRFVFAPRHQHELLTRLDHFFCRVRHSLRGNKPIGLIGGQRPNGFG